jgi:hypothetical protein
MLELFGECKMERATHLELKEVGPGAVEVPAVALEALDREGHDQAGPLSQLLDKRLLLRIRLRGTSRHALWSVWRTEGLVDA